MTYHSSIDDLLRSYPRERLLVPPVEWTPRHLEVLAISFSREEQLGDGGLGDDQFKDTVPPEPIELPHDKSTNGNVVKSDSPVLTASEFQKLFALYGPLALHRGGGSFHWGKEKTIRLHGPTYSLRKASNPSKRTPIFAFLQPSDINALRCFHLGINTHKVPGQKPNPPVDLLKQRQLRRLQPKIPEHEPYVAAVVLALAQARAEADPRLRKKDHILPDGYGYEVSALMVNPPSDTATFYRCWVSAAFLGRFRFPTNLEVCDPSPKDLKMEIKYKKISIFPKETLKDRLTPLIIPTSTPSNSPSS